MPIASPGEGETDPDAETRARIEAAAFDLNELRDALDLDARDALDGYNRPAR